MTQPAGGFRIARGFVEIVGKVDERQTKEAAEEAGKEAGESFEESFTKHWEKQQRDARGRFIKGFDKQGHDAGASSALRFGAKFTETVVDLLGKAGGAVTNRLGAMFANLPPQAQAAIGAGILAAVVAVAPLVAGVLSGAVVGAAGLGGILGGVLIASKHPIVKAAAKVTGEQFKETFQMAAAAFVPAIDEALRDVRANIRGLGPELQGVFGGLAKFVEPFTRGLSGFVENILPGFQAIADYGTPVIKELAAWLPKLGTLLSDVFIMFSSRSFEASRALATFWAILDAGIRIIAGTIAGLTTLHSWFEMMGLALTGQIAELTAYVIAQEASKKKGDEVVPTLQDIIDGFNGGATASAGMRASLVDLDAQFKQMTSDNHSHRAGIRDMEAAIDDATAAFKENGLTLDVNSPKGRANAAALDRLASATNTAYDATLLATGSQEEANEVMTRGRAKFIAMATAAGMSASEAERLAGQLFRIPNVNKTVTIKQQQAMDAIRAVQQGLGKINNKNITIGVWYKSNGDLKLPGGTQVKGAAEGGWIYGDGGPTDDKIPTMLSNKEFVLRARAAERLSEVFGDSFLPWLNNYDRGGAGARRPQVKGMSFAETEEPLNSAGAGRWADTGPRVVPTGSGGVTIQNVIFQVDARNLTDVQRLLALFESLPVMARQFGASTTSVKVR